MLSPQRPPLGLKPAWVHKLERMREILEAMDRYIRSSPCGQRIPQEWIDELSALNEDLPEKCGAWKL